jgi:hypothetical protein
VSNLILVPLLRIQLALPANFSIGRGFPATFAFVIAGIVVIIIIQLLVLREKRQKDRTDRAGRAEEEEARVEYHKVC